MDRHTRDTLVDGVSTIERIVENVGLSEAVKENAMDLYRRVAQKDTDIFLGNGIDLVAASCVILASRKTNTVCEPDDISGEIDEHIDSDRIHRMTRRLRTELDGVGILLVDPHTYVERLVEEFSLQEHNIEIIHETIEILRNEGVTAGHTASAVVASTFYMLVKYHPRFAHMTHTQKQIAEVMDISTVTIRNHYRNYLQTAADSEKSDIILQKDIQH